MIHNNILWSRVQLRFEVEKKGTHKNFFIYFYLSLFFLLFCRLLANFLIPLNDTTEARYSEIARKMLETGNWVTPLHDYGIPFWAKPPLSTWLSAASMNWLGVNEFAARFPSLLLSIALLALIWHLAKKQIDERTALITVVVLAGTFYFFLDAGTVMTEPALIFSTSLAFVSFWLALRKESVFWSYLFFVGLGLGLLAKGPIALVLVGLPLFFWVLVQKAWLDLWKKLPWIKGIFLVSLIALPWYLLAEHRTPGFLNYFIVGEHLHRFLTPGWTGDKYGMAHHAPKGMIFPYAFLGLMPWIFVVFFWLIHYRKDIFSVRADQGWMSYLLCFTLLPLLFFSLAGNIIYTYVFPIVPAFSLLFSELWKRTKHSVENSLWIPVIALTAGVCALVACFAFFLSPNHVAKAQKPVIEAWQAQHFKDDGPLYYWGAPPFSAQFYSQGTVRAMKSWKDLCQMIQKDESFYLAIDAVDFGVFPKQLAQQFQIKQSLTLGKNKLFLLYFIKGVKDNPCSDRPLA